MNTLTQINPNVKAEQMRAIAARNPTARALLLYLAITNNQTEALDIPFIKSELINRGVDVNDDKLFDAFQELEELDLGSLIYGQKGTNDVFRRNYNLAAHAFRAFPNGYVAQFDHMSHLNDPKFVFETSKEEVVQLHKESIGKRGRPAGYSPKLGGFMSPAAMAARQAKKAKAVKRGKVGRPKGFSHKLGRFLTPKEIAEQEFKKTHKNPVGRPSVSAISKRKPGRPPKFASAQLHMSSFPKRKPGRPVGSSNTSYMASGATLGRILTLPLSDDRSIRIELPKTLTKDDLALINLNLEHLVKNS